MRNNQAIIGRYRVVTRSGALTAIAAVTTTAGHLLSLRNPATSANPIRICIERVTCKLQLTVLPSVAQEFGISVFRTTSHTVNDSAAGAAVSLTTPQGKLKSASDAATAAIYFANGTAEVTGSTLTLDTLPMADERAWALVAGATIPINAATLDLDLRENPLDLGADEGIVVGNSVLMANSLAGRLVTAIEWSEYRVTGV